LPLRCHDARRCAVADNAAFRHIYDDADFTPALAIFDAFDADACLMSYADALFFFFAADLTPLIF